jgi:hypothetical protein
MWVVAECGEAYNTDKFLAFGIDSEKAVAIKNGNVTIESGKLFHIYGTLDDNRRTKYLLACDFRTEKDAQAALNSLLRHIKVGDRLYNFRSEE